MLGKHRRFELPFKSGQSSDSESYQNQKRAIRREKEPLLPAKFSKVRSEERFGGWCNSCASGVTQLLAVLIVVFTLGLVASRLHTGTPATPQRGQDLFRDLDHVQKDSRSTHSIDKSVGVSDSLKHPRPQEPILVQSGKLQASIDTRHAPCWHSLRTFASEGVGGQLDVQGLPLFTLVTHSGRKISSADCTKGKLTQVFASSLRISLSCPHSIEAAFEIHGPVAGAEGYLRLAVEVWAAEGAHPSSRMGWPSDGFHKITLFDARGPLAVRLTGPTNLPGLPLTVGGEYFIGGEHPLAFSRAVSRDAWINTTKGNQLATRVFVDLEHLGTMAKPSAKSPWRFGAVVGLIPESSQARRAFVNYLHHERPGRRTPMVHYNSWFDFYGWQDNFGKANTTDIMDESSCIGRVEQFGKNLVADRGVKVDSFLFDDGWDDTNTLWEFDHARFPQGFREVARAAQGYGSGIGVWLSPAGGYGDSQKNRIAQGRKRGFEISNAGTYGAFDLMGPKYRAWFLKVITRFRRDEGVNLFKFDGVTRVAGEMEAMLGMIEKVRTTAVVQPRTQASKEGVTTRKGTKKDDDEIWINLTTGTWASPFFLFWADSIWRGNGDLGPPREEERSDGLSKRQQWIRWRAEVVQENIVSNSAFFPLSQLMIHGVVIGAHGEARWSRLGAALEDEFEQEVWSFVGLGLQLQEMYISPQYMTSKNWDSLAEGLRWARANAHVLLDSHWAFGQVALREVFCVASWQPDEGRGFVLLQNTKASSQESRRFSFEGVLQLPSEQLGASLQVGIVKSVAGHSSDPSEKSTKKRGSSDQRLTDCEGKAGEPCVIRASTPTSILLHHTEVLILEIRLAQSTHWTRQLR